MLLLIVTKGSQDISTHGYLQRIINTNRMNICFRLDVEVEKAFKKGFAEERQKHVDDMKALNAAIEVKEGRITELLVKMAEMERKVMQTIC